MTKSPESAARGSLTSSPSIGKFGEDSPQFFIFVMLHLSAEPFTYGSLFTTSFIFSIINNYRTLHCFFRKVCLVYQCIVKRQQHTWQQLLTYRNTLCSDSYLVSVWHSLPYFSNASLILRTAGYCVSSLFVSSIHVKQP